MPAYTVRAAKRLTSGVERTAIARAPTCVLALMFSICALAAAGCSDKSSNPPFIDHLIVDDFPTWSPDGSTIAFQRRPPSQYGPSGLYLIPSGGGTPTLLTGAAYNFLSYSPSGDAIIAVGSRGLVSVSTTTGAEQLLTYTDNGILDPHMSSDGQRIAYARLGRAQIEPLESSGVHVLDLSTGVDSVLLDSSSTIVIGGWPRWAPAEPILAYTTNSTLSLIDLRTRAVTVLASAPTGYFFAHPRWVQSGEAIMYSEIGPINRTKVVNVTTHQTTSWPFFVGDFAAFAPQDSAFVFRAPQSGLGTTRYHVLFVRSLSDIAGSSIRQLTEYVDTSGGPAAMQSPHTPREE